MNLRKRFSLALAALVLVVLAGVSPAFAQEQYRITETPTFVINDGRAEVLGALRITPLTGVATIASSIDILYRNVACDNTLGAGAGAGIVLTRAGVYTPANSFISSVTNIAGGCTISITVNAGIIATDTDVDGDFDENSLEVGGVRGRIDASPAFAVNTDLEASVNATPSGSSLFISPTTVRIATSQPGIVVAFTARTQATCLGLTAQPRITITEGFKGAFVHHVQDAAASNTAAPLDARPTAGATNNTQIQIVITPPAGVTLSWPPTVVDTTGPGVATIRRITTATATTQVYEYTTSSQASSDGAVEVFVINATLTAIPATPPTPPTTTARVRLFPTLNTTGDPTVTSNPASAQPFPNVTFTAATFLPRFNNPFTADTVILTISPCTTNLLYTFVANVADIDTGIAIANTSLDPFTAPAATAPQKGTCAVHMFPSDPGLNGVAGGGSITVTTAELAAGSVWARSLSNTAFAGRIGYIIARCNFQFGHGYAYITNNFGLGGVAATTAQGYVANVIPDPVVLNTARAASQLGAGLPVGEGLGN